MPKKSNKKSFHLSNFSKLLLASVSLLIIGSIYQLLASGTGPLSSFIATENSINLVNGLDPDEAAFLQKTIKTGTPATKAVKVSVVNPISNKTEKAELRIENSNKPTTPNDALEAAEAGFLQNSINKDKIANGSVGLNNTMPTVKVTVTNPTTNQEESAHIILDSNEQSSLTEMTEVITSQVINVNRYNPKYYDLNREKVFCTDEVGNKYPNGGQRDIGNGQCTTCTIKYQNKSRTSYTADMTNVAKCWPENLSTAPKCFLYTASGDSVSTNKKYQVAYSTTPTDNLSALREISANNDRVYYGNINGIRTTFKCIIEDGVGKFKKVK